MLQLADKKTIITIWAYTVKGDVDVTNTEKNIHSISQNSELHVSSNENRKAEKEKGFIPSRVRYLRKKHKLKVEEICKYVDVARSTYTNYEQGHRTPPPDKMNKLAEILQTTPNYLSGYSDIEEPLNDNLRAIISASNLNWDGQKLTDQQKEQIGNIINGYFQSIPK
ncbi:TPA: helix-turn-helix transcriptional regulator [Bacillus thuringiensis]|uniref:helix-turn-helix domain-containing protein n=2 Tax=Bacillus cereus group TaxID=86661 RepID=UPI0009B2856A|nr:helix-turn-helix transcriptional regulator [Bacillus thuringiensis]OTY96098.1 transcriptional regulator [Bacillus thuringiensis serovar aizawai]MBU0451117.1 helix-turn-helix domain-containing protein [Bacillus thuringiensis]OUA23064.1 transcriptional regulator [Bacillus thuringiensis serovar aizawai]OUA33945.1 transcriptional regulator [Bacillus thuringiensis serovar aizawai]UQM92758.1 helix-turn-helix domain-containing protein [Bacillus thuringiensis]